MADDFLNDLADDSDLVKTLRSALRAKDKEFKEIKEQYESLNGKVRSQSLTEILKAKGLPDKVGKLLPADTEPTPEAVDAWLADFGDLFGIENPQTSADEGTVSAAQRMAAASAGAPPVGGSFDVNTAIAEMKAAKNAEELNAVMSKYGMN